MTVAESATLEATRVVRDFIAQKNDWVPRYLHNVDPSLVGYSIEFGELGWTMASPDIDGIECVATQQGGAAVDVECSNTYSVAKKSLRDAWELGPHLSN